MPNRRVTPAGPRAAPDRYAPSRCRRRLLHILLVMAVVFAPWPTRGGAAGPAPADTAPDFAEMSLKDLTGLEVFTAASLLPTETTKAPGTVYSFDREDFQRLGVRRLDDLLQFIPGFQLNQYRKRHRSIWARGILDRYNDKFVLLVDGVRVQHLYYGHFSLGDGFPLEKIGKVEVILGPASSLYGANAFAGIVSITTRPFATQRQTEATLEVGNHGRVKGTAFFNGERVQGFASYLDQDAPFDDDRKSFIGGETFQPRDEEYTNLYAKVSPFKGLTLSVDYSRNNTPFLFIPATQDSFVEERPLSLTARYEAGRVDTGRIEANAFYTRDDAREYEVEQQTRRLGYEEHQDATLAGSTVTGFKRLFDDHVFALGLSWQYEKAENMDFVRYFDFREGFLPEPKTGSLLSDPHSETNDYAVYVQDVWAVTPDLDLTLGGRWDDFDVFGSHFNYRAALVYTPDDRQVWKLLYGTAIRKPTLREYLKVLEGTAFNSPTPDPERIKSLELGYRYQWEQANLSLTLYHNEIEDYIRESPTPDGADEFFANSENDWRMRGLEALVQVRPMRDLRLRLGGGYMKAEERGEGDLPYLAQWNASFNLDYRYLAGHTAGLSLIYNSSREDTNDFPDDDPDSFVLTNLFGFGAVTKRLSYSFGVDNLFDERVFDPAADFGAQHNTERGRREIWARLEWRPDF